MSKPSTQNQGSTVQPNGNVIVDTICRTAEHGNVTIIKAEPIEPHQRIPHVRAAWSIARPRHPPHPAS
ncbi:hypothetical protein [Corynebacterium diphtheriae]|uniref:hypothetical protein n=1 Tax=Corynebacterium diphtheriae TaxID=1717 RepID=UPI0011776046|nr:hypothetical protein [Corynebacterium diphtheriae]